MLPTITREALFCSRGGYVLGRIAFGDKSLLYASVELPTES